MLKLVLPKGYEFPALDYGKAHTFKIYHEDEAAFDATGYTAYAMFSNEAGGLQLELPCSWTAQASGTGTFTFTKDSRLATTTAESHTNYYLEIQLELAGSILSTERKKVIIVPSTTGSRTP